MTHYQTGEKLVAP